MTTKFSRQSIDILNQAHPLLIKLFMAVSEEYDCTVTCAYRGKAEQESCFEKGTSKAHFGQSMHNYVPSLACNLTPYPSMWSDVSKQKELIAIVKIKAIDLGINITCGGDWKFVDLPHFELTDALNIIKRGEAKVGI